MSDDAFPFSLPESSDDAPRATTHDASSGAPSFAADAPFSADAPSFSADASSFPDDAPSFSREPSAFASDASAFPGAGFSAEAPITAARASFPDFGAAPAGDGGVHAAGVGLDLLRNVEIELSVELGRKSLPFAQVHRLATGSVIELDRLVGEPLVIYANGHPIGEGEVVVIGEQLGVRVTRLLADRASAPA